MKYLIVNADDFGYSFSVNKGIIAAHTEGIVTATSVMVDAVAAHEASELKHYPDLSVGLHFELKEIKNVKSELDRQVEKFITIVGAKPDHVNTHKLHTTVPGIKEHLLDYALKNNIPVRDFGQAKYIDLFFGFHSNGDVSVAQLKKAIDEATDNYNEIMCHVGYSDDYLREHSSYNDPRELELASICSPIIKQSINNKELTLCNWKQVK
ncbi:MAG: chitin disaccharide deacetylase [Candidatus Saccharimonadales bacterium]